MRRACPRPVPMKRALSVASTFVCLVVPLTVASCTGLTSNGASDHLFDGGQGDDAASAAEGNTVDSSSGPVTDGATRDAITEDAGESDADDGGSTDGAPDAVDGPDGSNGSNGSDGSVDSGADGDSSADAAGDARPTDAAADTASDAQVDASDDSSVDAGPDADSGLTCPRSMPDLCSTATGDVCVDTSSDANHCGACGHACYVGSTCLAGKCQATVFQSSTGGATDVITNGSVVYWLNARNAPGVTANTFNCRTTDGTACAGNPSYSQTLYPLRGLAFGVDTSGGAIAFFGLLSVVGPTVSLGTINRNGSPTAVGSVRALGGIETSGADVYYTDSVEGGVKVCAGGTCYLGQGTPVVVGALIPNSGAGAMAIDRVNERVVWADDTNGGSIRSCPLVRACPSVRGPDGIDGPPIAASGTGKVNQIVVTENGVYWTTLGTRQSEPGVLYCTSTACDQRGEPKYVIEALPSAYGLHVDTTALFVSTNDAAGTIQMCVLAPRNPSTCSTRAPLEIASNQGKPQRLSGDATGVYWGTTSAVMRIRKP